jgi:hypothetical protein
MRTVFKQKLYEIHFNITKYADHNLGKEYKIDDPEWEKQFLSYVHTGFKIAQIKIIDSLVENNDERKKIENEIKDAQLLKCFDKVKEYKQLLHHIVDEERICTVTVFA